MLDKLGLVILYQIDKIICLMLFLAILGHDTTLRKGQIFLLIW